MKRFFIEHSEAVDINHCLFSGQSFSWQKHGNDGRYVSAIINGSAVVIENTNDGGVVLHTDGNTIGVESPQVWFRRYFSLDVDTETLFSEPFRNAHPELALQLERYRGLRVLRQDPYETMVTFMCAQGIGMALIRRQVSMLARRYGEHVPLSLNGCTINLYRFPTPSRLGAADPMELRACTNNNLMRARNIISASQKVTEGCIDFKALASKKNTQEDIQAALSRCGGIGLKIADCIALFGLGRFDAFPIDTHVRQFLGLWFGFPEASAPLTDKNYRILAERARELLGEKLAGYRGHHLFHCWRTEVRKMQAF
ncbi:DNA-3-methyladenine glycosylase family protein [Pelodictyon luteolum]|uniref:DNA-(apurinic or apyrimidinic site) lyase n=1 Tax=Chlorobium luteolum (strain DSM 273 / BCRC 81028 / 2530) TaxID=319225 RepID=Q3B3Y2_CHLL3|nr:DNA glycosylase [Pelodictyon luteolum]ABB23949.1 HhH-GPD [Pelodictyon luteolum DSM 273]